MKIPILTLLATLCAFPVYGQTQALVSVRRTNRHIAGQVIDFTHNHGHDRRIYSQILGMPRDMYVYLPPGYTPERAYPLVLSLHGAFADEHAFLEGHRIETIDELICSGQIPPLIVACPDGIYSGRNLVFASHSLYFNGCGGRVEDHLFQEVLPFLMRTYSIRPEREAHAVIGLSAGGLAAMSIAIRHRDFFSAVASLSAPVNMLHSNCNRCYFEDFDPATYRWRDYYAPNEVVGVFAHGLIRLRAKTFVKPVFGKGQGVLPVIATINPASLIFSTDLKPGELAIYLHFARHDNLNFDVDNESFAWLAAQRGIPVTIDEDSEADHSLDYFRKTQKLAYLWLGGRILPPTEAAGPAH